MSDDNTVDFSAYAKKSGVRDSAKDIASFRGVFPSSWQAVCRDVLVAFKKAKMKELGYKRLGWTAIRDLIMEDFDARAGAVEVGRDSRLKRQDLEFWAKGSDLGPDKFWFVDRFLNKLRRDDDYSGIFRSTQREYEESQAHAFSEMYQRRSVDDDLVQYIANTSGKFLYSQKVEDSEYEFIAIKIVFASSGVFKVIVAYCGFDISLQNPTHFDSVVFYEGFLIPVPRHTRIHYSDGPAEASEVETVTTWLKMFRPEIRGSAFDGCADARLTYAMLGSSLSNRPDAMIFAQDPPTLMAPAIDTKLRDKRFTSKGASSQINFSNDQAGAEFLARMFDECYKGYLF